tara:strand:+ start:667 stop:873 length:207 start_codon:yes stop_codon:yes gene_type:complete
MPKGRGTYGSKVGRPPKKASKKTGTVARKKKQKTAAEMGSRPVQERDTGPGGMTATGSKTRRKRKTKK